MKEDIFEELNEDERKRFKRIRRIIKGVNYGLIGFFLYQATGYGYKLYESVSIMQTMKGKNNRVMDEEFYEEQNRETLALEERLRKKSRRDGTAITVNIYVAPEVKLFFDDAKNPNDNERWTREVEIALSGLEIYRQYGYSIEYDLVFTGPMETAQYIPGELTFLFAPAKQPESMFDEMLFGYTYLYGDTAVIFLTNNSEQNRFTVAHETGHMMGLGHREVSFLERLIDPFGFLSRGLMSEGKDCMGSYSLDKEEEETIKSQKERFAGEPFSFLVYEIAQ